MHPINADQEYMLIVPAALAIIILVVPTALAIIFLVAPAALVVVRSSGKRAADNAGGNSQRQKP
jgi:hypothetical protein